MTPYEQYLKSPHWQGLRRQKIAAQPFCSNCRRPVFLQVHHLKYRNPWTATILGDLQVLCRFCHASEHGTKAEINPRWIAKERHRYVRILSLKTPGKVLLLPHKRKIHKRIQPIREAQRKQERARLLKLDAGRSDSGYIIFPEDKLFSGRLDPIAATVGL